MVRTIKTSIRANKEKSYQLLENQNHHVSAISALLSLLVLISLCSLRANPFNQVYKTQNVNSWVNLKWHYLKATKLLINFTGMKIELRDEELILDKERAIYFTEHQLLAISDLHLGKAGHFRKAGLQVPQTVAQKDLERLSSLLHNYQPKTLLINGDMFHSDYNEEFEAFAKWKAEFQSINFVLVKGNHDKQDEKIYNQLNIQLYDPSYCTDKFCFIHDALKCNEEKLYPISGHLHPGIGIYNKAKQRLKFPCFYFGDDYAILPAFSIFTGLYLVKPKPSEQVFAITPSKVLRV